MMIKFIIVCLLVMSFLTLNAQIVHTSSDPLVVKKQDATESVLFQNYAQSSSVLSDSLLHLISNEVEQILYDNHFDTTTIGMKVPEVKSWIAQYVGQNPDGYEFAKAFTKYLRAEFDDKHFIFQQECSKVSGAVSVKGWYMQSYNYGLAKLEWLADKIGYIDYRGFNPAHMEDARQVLETAAHFVKNAGTIVLDLRDNPGGDGEMTKFLLGMLITNDSIHAWDYEYRFNKQEFKSNEYIKKNMTISLAGIKLFVLVGNMTGSAA